MYNKFSIYTAIAYANGKPHIGHAYEYVLADAITRYHRLLSGNDKVFFCTGMDEHGQKIFEKAESLDKTPQQLVDEITQDFKDLDVSLQISYNKFIKTTDEIHKKTAQDLWMKMYNKNDLYEKEYEGLYCIGCERYYKESELNERGECPDHLKKPILFKEKNWFFRLSKYADQVRGLIVENKIKIYPEERKNEIFSFIEGGVEDISFSRSKKLLTWGIEVPNDDTQVMYVWCDALTNYLTAGREVNVWGDSNMLNVIGKDILRFHALFWPSMLLSAGEENVQDILVHGHILSNGQKMSKTLGNVIDPQEVLANYNQALSANSSLSEWVSSEFFRYFILKNISPFSDGDVTHERMKELYNADLANGIGNLTNRIMKLCTTYLSDGYRPEPTEFPIEYTQSMQKYDVKSAFEYIFKLVSDLDNYMQTEQPFKVIKVDEEKGKAMLHNMRTQLYTVGRLLQPFMPRTSDTIKGLIKNNQMPEKPIFPRYE